jgi:hypothetical protein
MTKRTLEPIMPKTAIYKPREYNSSCKITFSFDLASECERYEIDAIKAKATKKP